MQLQHFNFDGNNIKAHIDDQGNPWFVAKEICDVLDISNSRDALTRLDEDEKGVATNDTLGGQQVFGTINESGLYSLILTSRKPEAKRFKKWVTTEVLPSIRKTGGYSVKTKTALELAREQVLLLEALENTQKQLAHAIETKAEIGSRREATSMATASVAVRERNKVLEELGRAQSMATIRAVNKATGEHFQFKPLKDYCKAKELDIGYAVDPLYGEVRSYPAQAWLDVYGVSLAKLFG